MEGKREDCHNEKPNENTDETRRKGRAVKDPGHIFLRTGDFTGAPKKEENRP